MSKKSKKIKRTERLETTAFTKDQWFGQPRRARNNKKSRQSWAKNSRKNKISVQISPKSGEIIEEMPVLDGDNALKLAPMQH